MADELKSLQQEGDEEEILQNLYCQRNKNKTILSVIKRMFGEHVRSRLVRMQNRELTFRVMAYNMHRLSVFMIWFLHGLEF